MPGMPPKATYSTFFASLSQDQKEEVIKSVAEEAALRFKYYVDAIHEGLGLKDPSSKERLQIYRDRQPQVWEQMQAQFPQMYDEQMKDWGRLESKDAKTVHPEEIQNKVSDFLAGQQEPTTAQTPPTQTSMAPIPAGGLIALQNSTT